MVIGGGDGGGEGIPKLLIGRKKLFLRRRRRNIFPSFTFQKVN